MLMIETHLHDHLLLKFFDLLTKIYTFFYSWVSNTIYSNCHVLFKDKNYITSLV